MDTQAQNRYSSIEIDPKILERPVWSPDYKRAVFEWLDAYKHLCGCKRCGLRDPEKLQFHHRDPGQKSWSVGEMVGRFSINEIRLEIHKCDVLCRRCHQLEHRERARRHQERLSLYSTPGVRQLIESGQFRPFEKKIRTSRRRSELPHKLKAMGRRPRVEYIEDWELELIQN